MYDDVEHVLSELLRRDTLADKLDEHIAKYFGTRNGAKRLVSKLFGEDTIMVLVAWMFKRKDAEPLIATQKIVGSSGRKRNLLNARREFANVPNKTQISRTESWYQGFKYEQSCHKRWDSRQVKGKLTMMDYISQGAPIIAVTMKIWNWIERTWVVPARAILNARTYETWNQSRSPAVVDTRKEA